MGSNFTRALVRVTNSPRTVKLTDAAIRPMLTVIRVNSQVRKRRESQYLVWEDRIIVDFQYIEERKQWRVEWSLVTTLITIEINH